MTSNAIDEAAHVGEPEPSVDARFCPGEYVMGSDEGPVGRIERVLEAPSGTRLLISSSVAHGSYTVALADDVVATQDTPATQLRWHLLRLTQAELVQRGTFRRQFGTLIREPLSALPSPPPSPPASPPLDDERAAATLRRVLLEDPLTRDSELRVRVDHGVAVLDGWIGTVGGKIAAERLARTTPGIWDAVNRLVSDEELGSAVRAHLRSDASTARDVHDVRVDHGCIEVVVRAGAGTDEAAIRQACQEVPGIRDLKLRAA